MIPNPDYMKITQGEFVFGKATVFSEEALKYKKFLPETESAGGGSALTIKN